MISLENNFTTLYINKNYSKEPAHPYTEHDLMRCLFKFDYNIEFNIGLIIMNNKDSEYITTDIYFGIKSILRIRDMIE